MRSTKELEADRQLAIQLFRDARLREDPSIYGQAFDNCLGRFEELLERLLDFDDKDPVADTTVLEVLTQPNVRDAFRYLAGPPLSRDDLLILADVGSVSPRAMRASPVQARSVFNTVMALLDRRRFPWVSDGRPPEEEEKRAALRASAALMAKERVQADRRNQANKEQEAAVLAMLADAGMTRVDARPIRLASDAPAPGHFSRTGSLNGTRADVIARLWDERLLAIECKVSNSAVNSVKRLNKEAVGTARKWVEGLGTNFIVPGVVLSGVFNTANLNDAQTWVSIWWSHDLGMLRDWVESTRL